MSWNDKLDAMRVGYQILGMLDVRSLLPSCEYVYGVHGTSELARSSSNWDRLEEALETRHADVGKPKEAYCINRQGTRKTEEED